MFAAIAWVLVMAILLWRIAALGSACIKWYYDPKRPAFVRALILIATWGPAILFFPFGLLVPLGVMLAIPAIRGPLFRFVVDFTLTIGMAAAIRLLIAGTSSAAVGAFVGLAISLMASTAGPYVKHKRHQRHLALAT